jgi:2-amino-4-hydroxy-6-hydroxymethyldihydropteridine diphosphokinase
MPKQDALSPVKVYLALGSNLGDRGANIRFAVEKISRLPTTVMLAVSSLLENPAVGGPPDSPPFLNAVAVIQTQIAAEPLLEALLTVEQSLGRLRVQKWEPRPIDLDIILYGDQIIHSQSLSVPHPMMHQRRFVLQPLVEIAPEVIHPSLKKTASQLLAELGM